MAIYDFVFMHEEYACKEKLYDILIDHKIHDE